MKNIIIIVTYIIETLLNMFTDECVSTPATPFTAGRADVIRRMTKVALYYESLGFTETPFYAKEMMDYLTVELKIHHDNTTITDSIVEMRTGAYVAGQHDAATDIAAAMAYIITELQ